MQYEDIILPLFLNTDAPFDKIANNEAPFIKGLGFDVNSNPDTGANTNNTTNSGQNQLVLTPIPSNKIYPSAILPGGKWNKNIGCALSPTTQQTFYFNKNSEGNDGIYVIDGNTGVWQPVIIDPELIFSSDPEAFISEHRVKLRLVYNTDGSVREYFLILTDGVNWQKFINVNAAIQTNGFDANLYPYWKLQPPHFDRRELFEYAVRPPMYKPEVIALPNTEADAGKINNIIDIAFQFAYDFNNTDGRYTYYSPYSLPIYVRSEDFLTNPNNQPKNIQLTLYAGSPLTEKINIYVRTNKKNTDGTANIQEWSEWKRVETLYKYSDCGDNSVEKIGSKYWLRTNPWANNNYNSNLNTITYIFDNSRQTQIVGQPTALYNDMPQLSRSLGDLNERIGLGWNRYGYDNFSCEVMNNFDAQVLEKSASNCTIPLRKVILYCYIGKMSDDFSYLSMPTYHDGDDTTARFGGVGLSADNATFFYEPQQSKYFELDYADRQSMRCYFKGTPYYADGVLCVVNTDNSITELNTIYDGSNKDQQTAMENTWKSGQYYILKFTAELPAGRYMATLGRHNVSSDGDYRNTSTYIMGLANSRMKSLVIHDQATAITPNALVSFSKEQQVDCTNGDVDVWGNNHDLFYVFCPYSRNPNGPGAGKYRFIEGYFQEAITSPIPCERFPYAFPFDNDACGFYTDKNGFYFAYTKSNESKNLDVRFDCEISCHNKTFTIPTSSTGIGWKQNPTSYLADHNNNTVGDCNRIIVNGRITALDGIVGVSNVAVTIYGGGVALTNQDGNFRLVVHNGIPNNNLSTVIYVVAGGSFNITTEGCGFLPVYPFDESLVPCSDCNPRIYPVPINLAVNIIYSNQVSLKEGGSYNIGIVGADLAGRMTFVNVLQQDGVDKVFNVPTFLQRNNVNPTYFQLLINGALNLNKINNDIKWVSVFVTKNLKFLYYIDWVGDSIKYIDNNGNNISDPSGAVFCSIAITSLYNYNISYNFGTLANYQFTVGDRMRILDDGKGQLLDVATYGAEIDLPVLGTNYNQAAMNANLIPNTKTNPGNNITVNTATTATEAVTASLLVPYDSRLDKLKGATGFWIEIYTPAQSADIVPFVETYASFPVINGEIAVYTGYDANAVPTYQYPTQINIDFWDTYFLNRSINVPNAGDLYFSHPFQSPNITDNFGKNITSGGRQWSKNPYARQLWYQADVIESDKIVNDGLQNGIGIFTSNKRHDFNAYPWGGIVAMLAQRSWLLFICENDYFTTDYQFHYVYPNAQGVMITNTDTGLGTPHQKIGSNFGCLLQYTSIIITQNDMVFWYDANNQCFVSCNYRSSNDICDLVTEKGERYGIKSYCDVKTSFVTKWNFSHGDEDRIDVVGGVDPEMNNIYFTFRPRRNYSNNPLSFVNKKRNWDIPSQETIVFNMDTKRWVRTELFTPESYGTLMGNTTGRKLLTFAAGMPYIHNDTTSTSFLNFYGVQGQPVITGVFNKEAEINKIFQNLCVNIANGSMFVDELYTNTPNSFSYVSEDYFKLKQNLRYATLLRDMYSYFSTDNQYRSTLLDGKRIFSLYMFFRLIGSYANGDKYFELKSISNLFTLSAPTKK